MPPTAPHPQPADTLPDVPVVDITATGPGRTPMQQIMDLMRRHGPVFVRRLHGRDTLFVSDLDLVTDLADERRFAKHIGPALENVRAFAADGLFTAYNDEPNWAKAHDILMPAFALGSMRTYHPVMLRVARRLIEAWDRGARDGQSVNVPEDMTRMTLDTIGLAGFDYDFGSFERDEPHPFVESMVRCLEWSMTRLARVPGNDYSAVDAAFRADADHLARVVDDVIAARTGTDQADAGDLLGATRLTDRAAADASGDLTGAVREFTTRLRTALLETYGDPDATDAEPVEPTTAYEVRTLTGGHLDALAGRHGLVPMTVTEAYDLTAPGHPRRKRFVRVALPDWTGYRTADHLTVLPANAPALVERAAAALGVDLDTVLDIRPSRPRRNGLAVDRPVTVCQLLTHYVELQDRPTAGQLVALAAANPCPPERTALAALTDDPRTFVELVEDHPALRGALDWPTLLDLLTPLRTRHYSISSSPAVDPGHADLMVSLLEAPARSGKGAYRGTGSGHLHTLAPGDTLYARVQPCREAFRIDDSTPVVMIAAGTGLAPPSAEPSPTVRPPSPPVPNSPRPSATSAATHPTPTTSTPTNSAPPRAREPSRSGRPSVPPRRAR